MRSDCIPTLSHRTPDEWTAELIRRAEHRLWLDDNRSCAVCGEAFVSDDQPMSDEDCYDRAEIVVDGDPRLAHQSCVSSIDQLA